MLGAPATAMDALTHGTSAPLPISHQRHGREDAPSLSRTERAPTAHRGDDDHDINQLWREYVSTRSPALRERLVAHYMQGHVVKVAERMKAQLPRQVEVDDLVQEGYLGLVAAIDRFSPERRVRFETFSSRRIFGAMRDYLRELDPIPRLTRLRFKRMEQVREAFRKANGREPGTQELRDRMHTVTKRLDRALTQGRAPAMVSFNSPQIAAESGSDADAMTAFEDTVNVSPLHRAELEDLRRWVTTGFSRRDRLIVVLYYYEQMTMKDIGSTLGCSESRVSQRLESIKDCLRARMWGSEAEAEFLQK
jgi:RNA polymerase sigma factor for flagellar operon FliA